MVAGILATAITRVLPDGFFLAFLVAGAGLLISGILTRYRADPVFAPPRLQPAHPEVAPASTDLPSRDDRLERSTS
jgi:hypothetical protein